MAQPCALVVALRASGPVSVTGMPGCGVTPSACTSWTIRVPEVGEYWVSGSGSRLTIVFGSPSVAGGGVTTVVSCRNWLCWPVVVHVTRPPPGPCTRCDSESTV